MVTNPFYLKISETKKKQIFWKTIYGGCELIELIRFWTLLAETHHDLFNTVIVEL